MTFTERLEELFLNQAIAIVIMRDGDEIKGKIENVGEDFVEVKIADDSKGKRVTMLIQYQDIKTVKVVFDI